MKMRKLIICCLFIISFIGCGTQATYVKHEPIDSDKGIIIAILPLQNNSPDRSFDPAGITLSDLIAAKMSVKKGFKIVERQKIKDLLKEMKLGLAGLQDENTAVKIGKMAGANVIALGSFSVFDNKVLLTMRLVKVETGEIVGGAKEKGNDASNLDVLADNAAEKLADSLSAGK